jgi:hypothetical protein
MTISSSDRVPAEFLAWARSHRRMQRRQAARLAQITGHPDPTSPRDAIGQQRAWARRRTKAHQLHDSAMAQLRHQPQAS